MSGVDDFPDDVTALARAVGVYRDSPEPGDGTASDEPVPYSLTDLAVIALEPGWGRDVGRDRRPPRAHRPEGIELMDAYLTTVEVAFIADVQQASARAVKGPRR